MLPSFRTLAAASLTLALAACYQTSYPLITAQNADWPLGDGSNYSKTDPTAVLPAVTGRIWRAGDTYLMLDDGSTDTPAEIMFHQIRDNFYAVQRNNGSYNYDLARIENDVVYTYGLQCSYAEDAAFITSGALATSGEGVSFTCTPNSLDSLASALIAKSSNLPSTEYALTGAASGPPPAPVAQAETQTQIAVGQTVQGQIAAGDSTRDGKYYDAYRFTATAGQTITIQMNADPLDTYLSLYSAENSYTELAFDDDSGGNLDARISYKIARSGDYVIHATTAYTGLTGAYTLILSGAGGTAAPAQDDQILSDDPQAQIPIQYGGSISGTLNAADFVDTEGNYFDVYRFTGTVGDQIEVRMDSTDVDAMLYLYDDLGNDPLAQDDDGGDTGANSLLRYKLSAGGTYLIIATTFGASDDGAYTISLTRAGGGAAAGANVVDGIDFGDNTSNWANNGICDDPRFQGPGMTSIILDEDLLHDSADCLSLYRQGRVSLR